MKIILTGLEEFGLPGEIEFESHPTGREMTRFRKEAQITPSDLTDALNSGAVEVVQLYVYTALQRDGNPLVAAGVLDIPLDKFRGIEIEDEDDEDEEVAADEQLPPTLGNESPESEPRDA